MQALRKEQPPARTSIRNTNNQKQVESIIAFYQTGSYQIVVRAANKYGMGEYTVSGVTVYNANNNAAMIAYPNPANQTLYVDFSSIGEQQAKAINSVPVQQKTIRHPFVQLARFFGTQCSIERRTDFD